MTNKILTIVIPTYNMQEYLERCINSLIIKDKTLLNTLQIIIVNDGSKDESLKIAQTYEKKYPDSIIVIDKENNNYGSCINKSIEFATGVFFKILDADDYYDNESLREFINRLAIIPEDIDAIFTDYCYVYSSGKKKIIHSKFIDYNKVYDLNEVNLTLDPKTEELMRMHGVTYRTSILRKCELKLSTGISYTDSEYCFYPYQYINKVIFLDINLYHYQLGREGQTVSDISFYKNRNNLLFIINRMLNYWIINNINKESSEYKYQSVVFLRNISVYFSIILSNSFNETDNNNIHELDLKIKQWDNNLYNKMYSLKKHKIIPYIYLWRKYNLYSSNVLIRTFSLLIKRFKS